MSDLSHKYPTVAAAQSLADLRTSAQDGDGAWGGQMDPGDWILLMSGETVHWDDIMLAWDLGVAPIPTMGAAPIDLPANLPFDVFPGSPFAATPGDFFWMIEDPDGELSPLVLNAEHGYCVTQYDLGYPTPRTVTRNHPLNDGTYDLTQYGGARNISLTISFLPGPGIPDALLRSRLAAFMHPKRRPILSFVEHEWAPWRRAVVRGANLKAQVKSPKFGAMVTNWVAPTGVLESYDLRSVSIDVSVPSPGGTGGGGARTVQVLNQGDMDAHWRFEITNLKLDPHSVIGLGHGIELDLDGRSVKLMTTLDPSEKLHVDSEDKSVTIVDGSGSHRSLFQRLDVTSEWWQIPTGLHQFSFWVLNANGDRIDPGAKAKLSKWTANQSPADPEAGVWQPAGAGAPPATNESVWALHGTTAAGTGSGPGAGTAAIGSLYYRDTWYT